MTSACQDMCQCVLYTGLNTEINRVVYTVPDMQEGDTSCTEEENELLGLSGLKVFMSKKIGMHPKSTQT